VPDETAAAAFAALLALLPITEPLWPLAVFGVFAAFAAFAVFAVLGFAGAAELVLAELLAAPLESALLAGAGVLLELPITEPDARLG
jgi:hypothetical protein